MTTQILKYNDQKVEFEFNKQNVMVNATEMAKIFDADVWNFLRLDGTKKFIEACLKTSDVRFLSEGKSDNSHFLGIENEEDLYTSKQKTGTWMHLSLLCSKCRYRGGSNSRKNGNSRFLKRYFALFSNQIKNHNSNQ